jgi:putative colanic acid biosynthesis UDP-glucose lipid carrier transferase
MLNRFIYLGIRIFSKDQKYFLKRIVILGYNDAAKKLATYLESETSHTEVIGFIDDEVNIKELTHYPVLASVEHTLETSKELAIDEIYSTITPEQNKSIYGLMQQAESECIRFKIIPDLSHFIQNPIHIEYLNDMPILCMRKEPLEDVGNRIKKRIFDVIISSLVIVFVLSWLIPLLSLLIYIESPGPVFFLQLRTGKNKKAFLCLKFRSMHINPDSDKKQATKNDTRFTNVGKFIRKTNLDEFPQFINVLKGEMSLVGPRPHMLRHTEDYSKMVSNYMVRQLLKPGITGWAQVNGYRCEIKGNEQISGRVESDIWYSENWSLWLDIKVMFLTIFNMFKGEQNAY